MLHLRTPTVTDTVRIDAGFVVGDEVTSHYDPMIAKLIVQGTDRNAALQKLRVALESYEIAGPITNIEFLKKMCVSPDFVAGEVETGYIEKHRDELFRQIDISEETWIQAALGLYIAEQTTAVTQAFQTPETIGFNIGFTQPRKFDLVKTSTSGAADGNAPALAVSVQQIGPHTFSVTVADKPASIITSKYDEKTKIIQSFFPHTRLESTLIINSETNALTVFQQGVQYRLQLAVPKWAEKALGMEDVANSVLAPMPCKVLRVEVQEGDEVKKNQILVVIESMKMETVIRAPTDGVVKRVVHKPGELCKAGTKLVEFVEEESS